MVAALMDAPRITRADWGPHIRCEQCLQPAITRAWKVVDVETLELAFCGHHSKRHFDALVMQGFQVEHNPIESGRDSAKLTEED